MTVRVRFAPSPTGMLTVGGLRTALFNWLFARHAGGTYILRIEDTDRTRFAPGALQALAEAHQWLGIDWDEGPNKGGEYGPYFQSERLDRYRIAADGLVAQGDAYRCYCSTERLDAVRAEQRRHGRPTGYDGRCRDLDAAERATREAGDAPYVIRFKMPRDGVTRFVDAIRGEIEFPNDRYDDHVLLKSDGFGTYHLTAICDDIAMKISHAFRAEEWLPSTPRHLLTFRALGAEPPIYAHLPVVLGKDRKKLSKRHGDTSVSAYREQGYLPDAMFNFLGLTGWSLDDHSTIITRQQFIEHFTIERVVKAPALFDPDKLLWMNGQYLQALPDDAFAAAVTPFLERDLPPSVARPIDAGLVRAMASELKTRVKKLDEAAPLTWYLFANGTLDYDSELLLRSGKKTVEPGVAAERLAIMRAALGAAGAWDSDALDALFTATAERSGVKKGDLLGPLRAAISGSATSLPMHTSLALLGREGSLARIDGAMQKLA